MRRRRRGAQTKSCVCVPFLWVVCPVRRGYSVNARESLCVSDFFSERCGSPPREKVDPRALIRAGVLKNLRSCGADAVNTLSQELSGVWSREMREFAGEGSVRGSAVPFRSRRACDSRNSPLRPEILGVYFCTLTQSSNNNTAVLLSFIQYYTQYFTFTSTFYCVFVFFSFFKCLLIFYFISLILFYLHSIFISFQVMSTST